MAQSRRWAFNSNPRNTRVFLRLESRDCLDLEPKSYFSDSLWYCGIRGQLEVICRQVLHHIKQRELNQAKQGPAPASGHRGLEIPLILFSILHWTDLSNLKGLPLALDSPRKNSQLHRLIFFSDAGHVPARAFLQLSDYLPAPLSRFECHRDHLVRHRPDGYERPLPDLYLGAAFRQVAATPHLHHGRWTTGGGRHPDRLVCPHPDRFRPVGGIYHHHRPFYRGNFLVHVKCGLECPDFRHLPVAEPQCRPGPAFVGRRVGPDYGGMDRGVALRWIRAGLCRVGISPRVPVLCRRRCYAALNFSPLTPAGGRVQTGGQRYARGCWQYGCRVLAHLRHLSGRHDVYQLRP